MNNCKVIAITNQKGGVGKTTTAANLGAGLVRQGTCVVCSAKDTVIDEGSKLVDTPEDSEDSCSHICHSTGFSNFFWKIIQLFWKLFRINPVCECGAAHY